jgi:hypothetical protein
MQPFLSTLALALHALFCMWFIPQHFFLNKILQHLATALQTHAAAQMLAMPLCPHPWKSFVKKVCLRIWERPA